MNIKPRSLACAAAVTALLWGAWGCQEHPSGGEQQEEQARPATPEAVDQQAGSTSDQVGEEGSELSEYTGPLMEKCIEVVGRVMHCSSQQEFNDLVLGKDGPGVPGWSPDELQRKVQLWQRPGGQRQTCEQLVRSNQLNPFKVPEPLEKMAGSANDMCVDFGRLLIEMEALEALANVEI